MVKIAINAVECLAAGECLVMEKIVFNILAGFAILSAILLVVLIFVGFTTPALIFLKAKLRKQCLIYCVNRGQTGKFLVANPKYQGIVDIKKVGPYIITENSHTIEQKSKVPFFFGFGEFAATLPLEYAQLIQNLRKSGKKISNIDDLAEYAGMEFDNTEKVWKQTPEENLTPGRKKLIDELKVKIEPFKTISLHNLAYMFPFNITPALIESKTQHMIGIKMHMFNKLNIQYVLMFIMILMGTTLAAVIAFKFIKTGDTTGVTETRTVIERIVTQNLTG